MTTISIKKYFVKILERILSVKLTFRFLIWICLRILVIKWTIIILIQLQYLDIEQLLISFVVAHPELFGYLNININSIDTNTRNSNYRTSVENIIKIEKTAWYDNPLFSIFGWDITWRKVGIAIGSIIMLKVSYEYGRYVENSRPAGKPYPLWQIDKDIRDINKFYR